MRVSVVGTGYVGLVVGAGLAEHGHQVVCVDLDAEKVDRINHGEPPIYERGLDELLRHNVPSRLRATTDLEAAVLETELSLIAVGTPFDGEAIDLSQIRAVAAEIGAALREKDAYHTVVVKSTVVPGTTDTVVGPILEDASGKRAGPDFGLGMNPEFLREGEAVRDFLDPDRIVLGGVDARTHAVLEELYAPFAGVARIRTSNRTAEMIKYASNSLLATMISYSNEIANLCAELGDIDVREVLRGVHLDRRLTPILTDGERVRPGLIGYLEAGCGFGGSCFPKDVQALIAQGQGAGLAMQLLQAVIDINRAQPGRIVEILQRHFDSLEDVRIAVLGLAFKPGTNDMRESPAIPVVRTLWAEGARLTLHDPVAVPEAKEILGTDGLRFTTALDEAVDGVDAVVLLTAWPEYLELPDLLKRAGADPLVVDGRRLLDPEAVTRYEGIGLRRRVIPSLELAGD